MSTILKYIKSKFTIPWNHRHGDLFLAEELQKCKQDNHYFYKVVTKNGIRIDGESPCQCKKYNNLIDYSKDVDRDI
jgi:hypothetical protein